MKEKFEAVLPPMRLPSSEALLVYKVTAAFPNEIAGNDVDCFILAPYASDRDMFVFLADEEEPPQELVDARRHVDTA
jgi:hypothetical protein